MSHRRATRHNTPETEPVGNWRTRAECRFSDPELFFPTGRTSRGGPAYEQAQRAKSVCARCPAIQACLQEALENGEQFGIWGGLTEDERRAMQRRNQRNTLGRRATSEMSAIL